jgi:hypothetical protein
MLKKVPVQTRQNKTNLAKLISFYIHFIAGKIEKIAEKSITLKVAELKLKIQRLIMLLIFIKIALSNKSNTNNNCQGQFS